MRHPRAAGSCHKPPSRASTQASGVADKIWREIKAGQRPAASSAAIVAGPVPDFGAQPLDEPCSGNALCCRTGSKNEQDGTAMADDKGRRGEAMAPREKDSRQDRLKSALRENLRRRKMQARERDKERGKKNDMPSSDHRGDDEASPPGELGKRGD